MDATARRVSPFPRLPLIFLGAPLVSAQGAFLLVTLLLLGRRLAGQLQMPLPAGLFLLASLGGAAITVLLRSAWLLSDRRLRMGPGSSAWMLLAMPGITYFLLLAAVSLPGTAAWGLMLGWLLLFTSEATWWWLSYQGAQRLPSVSATHSADSSPPSLPPPDAIDSESLEGGIPTSVFQQITRSREGEDEVITGLLRADFAAGQRLTVLHVAFCPPLDAVPEISFAALEGPDATVKATLVQSFGTRLEVRLEDSPDEPCSVVVELSGTAKVASSPGQGESP